MTPTSRLLIVCSLLGILFIPNNAFAAIGLQGGSSSSTTTSSASSVSSAPETVTEPEVDTGALLEMQRLKQLWVLRRARTEGFWAAMMNSRKAAAAFREQQEIRRQKRTEKRLACREDVRRANRDAITSVTFTCFRATLTLDLEMLRKEKQFVEEMAGPTETYRSAALFHIANLMDAISTVVQAMDAGVYGSKEGLTEAKTNLGKTYGVNRRLAMSRLRVDRAITWVMHLMVRMDDIRSLSTPPAASVLEKIDATIACLEDRQSALEALLPLEDNDALIGGFRQVQSELKFCSDLALEAQALNTEIEQAEAQNEESEN